MHDGHVVDFVASSLQSVKEKDGAGKLAGKLFISITVLLETACMFLIPSIAVDLEVVISNC